MPSEVPNLSFSSRIKVHLGLTGKRFEIRHYSYNLPLALTLKTDTTDNIRTEKGKTNANASQN